MSRRGGAGPFTAVAGGLLLVGGGAASWVVRQEVREVGAVQVPETVSVPGTVFAPAALPFGLALLLVAAVAALVRGTARRAAGALCALVSLVALLVVGIGIVRAWAAPGGLAAGPWAALAGAGLGVVGGLVAARASAPAPLLDGRYRLEQGPEDDEWTLASDEPPGEAPPGADGGGG